MIHMRLVITTLFAIAKMESNANGHQKRGDEINQVHAYRSIQKKMFVIRKDL